MSIKILSFFLVLSSSAHATKVNGEKIDVEGIVEKKDNQSDTEVDHFRTELNKIKFQNKNNKKKIGLLKKLTNQMDKLSTTHEEFILQRQEWEEKVSQFNQKVDCLQKKGEECGGTREKNIETIDPQAEYEQAVSQKINANIDSLKGCYQRELDQGNHVSGTINTVLEISQAGELEHTHILNEDRGVENIRRCIVHVLHQLTFPPTPNQKTFQGVTSINLL